MSREPHLDQDMPKFPYTKDFKAIIKSHNPPPPFGNIYGPGNRLHVPDSWLKGVSRSQHVLEYPPLNTADPQHPIEAELAFIKGIAIGKRRGAQLVLCSVAPHGAGETYQAVAKIYDALYYPFDGGMFDDEPLDAVWSADEDYSREAAAYECLQADGRLNGAFAPEYFGSWTFTLPSKQDGGVTTDRPVRLVLVEHLDGPSMSSLLYSPRNNVHHTEQFRLAVFAKLLHEVSRMVQIGVGQGDFVPRNIMLVPQGVGLTGDIPRVVLIDYNSSIVWERTADGYSPKPEKPQNPIQTWWGDCFPDFAGWIPDEWFKYPKLRQQWLLDQFGGEGVKESYKSITKKLEFDNNVY